MAEDVGIWIAIALIGYIFGSFPSAYVLVKLFTRKNVLEWGTGNVGTLNVHRATSSKALTLLTLVSDLLKAGLAILVGVLVAEAVGLDHHTGAGVGGIAAVVGHNYSIFLRFKGGKGLTCSASLGFYFAPALVGLWVLSFLVTVMLTRWLVVGQMAATAALPILAYFLFPQAAIPSYFVAALILVRHAPRIKNILDGTEPKMYYKIRSPSNG